MKLQQLRYLVEVAERGLNVTDAAQALHTSQPGISKQIALIEAELGVEIFLRAGKRFTGVTEPGVEIIKVARRMLLDAGNLKRVAQQFGDQAAGSLTIATTHTQARYALPDAIRQFTARYPHVRLSLRQGNPTWIAQQVASGEADIAIATEAIELFDDLAMLPCYQWNRCIIAPPGHPILRREKPTIADVAAYPIVTYDFAFTGRSRINAAFEAAGVVPNVVLTAIDADVIKTYVALGLGIGIIAKMAFDPAQDRNLRALDAAHLFEPSTTRIGLRRNFYLRGYVYDFIEMFAPHLDRATVDAAMK
ncbi:MAG: HTH-type transcriptional regulator CysB [Sulfuricella sp.]|nr:HTH-type transcriptional regulator CysB [Sulfuricella sp.]